MDIIAFRSTQSPENFNPRAATKELLMVLAQDFHIAYMSNSANIEGPTILIRTISIKDGEISVDSTDTEIRVAELGGVINRSPISLGAQIAHPSLSVMNNGQLRVFSDKQIQSNRFPELFLESLVIPGSIQDSKELPIQVKEYLDSRSEFVVVKAVDGSEGKRMARLKPNLESVVLFIKEQNTIRIQKGKNSSDFILQPYAPPQEISGLKGHNVENQRILEEHSSRIELRVYSVGTVDSQYIHVVGRVINLFDDLKHDDWILLNQDTIPPEIIRDAYEVTSKLISESSSKIGLIAVDFFKFNDRFLLREINLRDPNIYRQADIINYNIARAFKEA